MELCALLILHSYVVSAFDFLPMPMPQVPVILQPAVVDGTTPDPDVTSSTMSLMTTSVLTSDQTALDNSAAIQTAQVTSAPEAISGASSTSQNGIHTAEHPGFSRVFGRMGVFVRIAESGGKLEVSSSSDFVANKTIQVQFDYITEKALNDAGEEVNVSSGSHSADLSKETSFLILDSVEPNNSYYPGTETPVTVASFDAVAYAERSRFMRFLTVTALIHIDVYIFHNTDKIEVDGKGVFTYPGLVQADLSVSGYTFCDLNTTDYMTHCSQMVGHALELHTTVKVAGARFGKKEDSSGPNYYLFDGVGYIILKHHVMVDNAVIPINLEEAVSHNTSNEEFYYKLRVPRFTNMVTTRINIEMLLPTHGHMMNAGRNVISMDSMRSLVKGYEDLDGVSQPTPTDITWRKSGDLSGHAGSDTASDRTSDAVRSYKSSSIAGLYMVSLFINKLI